MPAATAIRTTQGRGRLFDSILDTVGDTPVIRINNLGVEGRTIYVKAEFFNPASSVKDRLALNIIEAAERAGALKPGQTVVEATSGNTGIGLAMVCAQKGYPLVVTMADSFSIERRKLMRMLGAKVVLTPRAQKGFGMYQKAVELAETNGWFLARQFETEANADIHERTTAREIINDFAGERLDCLRHRLRHRRNAWPASRACCGASGPKRASCFASRPTPSLSAAAVRRSGRRDGAPAASHPAWESAPDPGLDAGLHPGRPARGDRRHALRRTRAGRRRRGHGMGEGARAEGGNLHRHLRRLDLRRRRAGSRERAPAGSVILCMLPDTGERYMTHAAVRRIEAEMNEEELALSRSTPSCQFPAA